MKSIRLSVFLFVAAAAFAQSSGNFSASINKAQCIVNDQSGALSGGINTANYLATTIKTPNATQTALLIRPSFVTGLFTQTKISTTTSSAYANAGVKVRVLMDENTVVAPGTQKTPGVVTPDDGWVYYDKRYQALSTNLFNTISTCGIDPITGLPIECSLDLILSTLGAHSLDFVAPDVGGGAHSLKVQWALEPSSANANEKACVGPGVLTVEQVKTFSSGGGVSIQ